MDLSEYEIRPTKHFALGWMRKWDWNVDSLRDALVHAHKVDKIGKYKYEAYIQSKGKSRKIIFIKSEEPKEIIVITGAEGK